MMNLKKELNEFSVVLASLEGKKSQTRIGDIRELLGIISDVYRAWPLRTTKFLLELSDYRSKKALKKKKK